MLRCVKQTEYLRWLVFSLLFLVLSTLFSIKSPASGLFEDWYGLSHVSLSPLFLQYTPQVKESVSFLDELSIFYSFEKSADVNNPDFLRDGFTLFSTFSNFFKLSGVKYWHRGGYYDFWSRLIHHKDVKLSCGLGIGLSVESVSISLGNSKTLEDFDEFGFPHENRVHLLNLLGRLVFNIEISTHTAYLLSLRYSIGYNVIWTAFGPYADSLVLIDSPSFERFRSHWQHSVALKLRF